MLNRFALVGVYDYRMLLRCSQPDENGLAVLKMLPIRTIYKLNSASEADPEIERKQFVVIENEPSQFAPSAEWCRLAVMRVGELLDNGSVAIHCTHGRDRTGLLCAAWRVLHDGWTADKALEEFYSFGVTGFIKWSDHEIVECIKGLA